MECNVNGPTFNTATIRNFRSRFQFVMYHHLNDVSNKHCNGFVVDNVVDFCAQNLDSHISNNKPKFQVHPRLVCHWSMNHKCCQDRIEEKPSLVTSLRFCFNFLFISTVSQPERSDCRFSTETLLVLR